MRQRRPRSRGLLLLNRWVWWFWGGVILWRPILEQICTWLSLQTDYAIRPSWTPLCRGVNNWSNSPAKSGRLIGCAPGHQVTPRLCVLFHAGASGDSSPLRAFPRRGIRWLLTFARFSAQGDEVTPLHREGPISPWISERVESSTHGRRWCGAGFMWMRVSLYTWQPLMWGWHHVNERLSSIHGRRWCGAGFMWMRVSLYTWQPLMWGWNHVNQRLSSTHGRPLLGGWYRVNKRAVSSRHGSHWWGAGIVWMSEEPSDCALHTAERRSEAGGCKLRQWVCPCGICCDMRTHSSCIYPRFSAPPWKGNVRSRADVLSCRFDGWEECGHSRHKLITRVLKVHHWSRADRIILKKKSYSPERCRGAAIQACPRMSEPQLWAVLV